MKTWFVTGASRGLGKAIATEALRSGANVIATARNLSQVQAAYEKGEGSSGTVLPLELDVTNEKQVATAVATASAKFGRIDYLVNNAGRGLVGAVEEVSASEAEAVFGTNVFGALNMIRAVLPLMRAARSGTIVNIGSMGGFAQVSAWGVYGATKFALEGLTEAMRAELAPLGIKAMIVEPGSFRTNFLEGNSIQYAESELADYDETVGQVRKAAAAASGDQPNDPAKGAAAIYIAATAASPPSRLQLGPDAIAMVEAKLTHVRDELEAWRPLSESTLFESN